MKPKQIFYECPKCKLQYSLESLLKIDIPTKVKKDKQGKIIEVLETRKIPVCQNCNCYLVRRVERK